MKSRIIQKLVAKLDRKLTEARQDNPSEEHLSGRFTFGRVIVTYSFSRRRGCEIELYNPILETFLDNVSCYCEKRVIGWDNVEIEETDDWNDHGFRDAADYLRYKYG